ncbi:MAG: hypothetical protein CR993_03255, partial [Rhodobacterales bacterium]
LIVLLGKASDFRDQTAAMLAPQAERLERIATALEGLDKSASSPQTAAEVEKALARLPDLSGLEKLTVRSVVEEVLKALGDWLSRADLSGGPGGAAPDTTGGTTLGTTGGTPLGTTAGTTEENTQ